MEQLAFMLGLVGGLSLVLYAMRKDAPRHERLPVTSYQLPVMSPPEEWEKEGEGWKSQPEPEDTGAPGYYLPPTAARFGPRYGKGCPKCVAMNALRAKMDLPPFRGTFRVRISDLAVWCNAHNEAFLPMPKGGLEAITVDKAA